MGGRFRTPFHETLKLEVIMKQKTYLYVFATIAILVVLALLRISLDKSSPASYEPEEITEESETESL